MTAEEVKAPLKVFEAKRTDTYMVNIEATSIEEARILSETESKHLNDGSYVGSSFRFDGYDD